MPDQQSLNCYMMQVGPAWVVLNCYCPVPGLEALRSFGRLNPARDDMGISCRFS